MVEFKNGITPINDDNLNKLQTDLQEEIKNINEYSTYEKKIGTWIDGKPLYRKCIKLLPNISKEMAYTTLSLNVNNVKFVNYDNKTSYYNDTNDNANYGFPLQYTNSPSSIFVSCWPTVDNDNSAKLQVRKSTNVTIKLIFITLYYTKTTD